VLLANPRWERRFVKFLELTGVGRTMADGTDEDGAHVARMDEWVAWGTKSGALGALFVSLPFLFCKGACPRGLRTAHRGGRRISSVSF